MCPTYTRWVMPCRSRASNLILRSSGLNPNRESRMSLVNTTRLPLKILLLVASLGNVLPMTRSHAENCIAACSSQYFQCSSQYAYSKCPGTGLPGDPNFAAHQACANRVPQGRRECASQQDQCQSQCNESSRDENSSPGPDQPDSRPMSQEPSGQNGSDARSLPDGGFGVIAYNKATGKWGQAHNYQNYESAERAALNACGEGCVVMNWEKNKCNALAAGGGHWGRATGYGNSTDAENAAVSSCAAADCKILVSICD